MNMNVPEFLQSPRNLTIIALILGFLLYLCYSRNSTVLAENFTSHDPVKIRMFYVTWCGHCTSTKPDFIEYQNEFNNKEINGRKIEVEMIDCDQETELAEQNGVNSYPTFKALKDGETINYPDNLGRSKNDFVTWTNSLLA